MRCADFTLLDQLSQSWQTLWCPPTPWSWMLLPFSGSLTSEDWTDVPLSLPLQIPHPCNNTILKHVIKYNTQGAKKIGKERGNSYQKNEEITRWKAYTNTTKHNWNVSTITYIYSLLIKKDWKYVRTCNQWWYFLQVLGPRTETCSWLVFLWGDLWNWRSHSKDCQQQDFQISEEKTRLNVTSI